MKSSLMKLNHVSTFSGEGQTEILHHGRNLSDNDFSKKESKKRTTSSTYKV